MRLPGPRSRAGRGPPSSETLGEDGRPRYGAGDVQPKPGMSTEPLGPEDVEAIRRLHEQQAGPPAVLVYHPRGAEHVPVPEGHEITLGREGQIALQDSNLSRLHARIHHEPGAVVVEDLGSTNGLWIGGERVRRVTMRPGDAVCLGSPRVVVQLLASHGDLVRPILGHDAWSQATAAAVSDAAGKGERAAVVLVRSHPERTHVHRWYEHAALSLPPAVLAGLYTPDTLELLVPRAGLTEADGLARRLRHLLGSYGVRLAAGVAAFPDAAADAMQLLAAALDALEQTGPHAPVGLAPLRSVTRPGEIPATVPFLSGEFFRTNARALHRIAASPSCLLLLGATGSGKEVVARMLHATGPRAAEPFIAVHCGALPESLLASELFGHLKGSFSGATADKEGLFRAAGGGTIFLDEIGEAPPAVQVSLLRALEVRAVRPVGGTREVPFEARVIAATHRDLEGMVREGRFRDDLYYRLCELSFVLPSLRDRRDEIEPIALRFLAQANTASGGQVNAISPEALELLRRHDWPGNIRELRNTIRRAAVLAETDRILPVDLPDALRRALPSSAPAAATGTMSALPAPPATITAPPASPTVVTGAMSALPAPPATITVPPLSPPPAPASPTSSPPASPTSVEAKRPSSAREIEMRERLLDALRRSSNNQTRAAELLGMPRRTFVYWLKKLGLSKRYGDGDG